MRSRLRLRWLDRLACLVALCCALFSSARAWGDECPAALERWVEGCRERSGQSLRVDGCPPGMLLVRAALDDSSALRIELRRPAGAALVTVDELGISPIGEFPSWDAVSSARKRALDAVVGCARSAPVPSFNTGEPAPKHNPGAGERAPPSWAPAPSRASPPVEARPEAPARPPSRPTERLPWTCLLGLLAAFVVVVASRGRGPLRANERRAALGAALLCAAAQVNLLDWSYFLQNGHGVEWTAYASTGLSGMRTYGPGYAELLSALVNLEPTRPEAALAWVYLALGVTIALTLYVAARGVGARPALAAALTLAVALDPTVTRLIRSETYHAPILALHCAAAALLVVGARRRSAAAPGFLLAALGAGMFIAQAARVHPVGWLAAATLPAALLAAPGQTRVRVTQLAVATATIAGVVALSTLPTLLHTYAETMPRNFGVAHDVGRLVTLELVAVAAIAAISWRVGGARGRALLIAGAALVSASLAVLLNPVGVDYMRYQAGYFLCFAPTVALCVAGLAARLLPRRRAQTGLAAALLALASALALATWGARTQPATDALESTWALEWRARASSDWSRAAGVVYLSGGDGMGSINLPLYTPGSAPSFKVHANEVPAFELREPALYYRSSVCSGAGRETCEALERRLALEPEPVLTREFPAVASQSWNLLPGETVTVELFVARPR